MGMIESRNRATSDPEARRDVLRQIEEGESTTSSSGSPTSRGT